MNNTHLFPNNPYSALPPQVAHKVWILDCKTCNTFFTNRAMRAVLLLRPNVALYSSDILPANCSVFSSKTDIHLPSLRKGADAMDSLRRTCDCLTQTFCCHGCGNIVGYVIVIPCTRCTASISTTSRPTNGHRFVFHSSEVVGSERYYIKDEPNVIKFDTISQNTVPEQFLPRRMEDLSLNQPPSTSNFHLPNLPPHRPSLPLSNGVATEQKDPSLPYPCLQPGDVLFWHHLSRSGEMSGVEDDKRARNHLSAKAAKTIVFDR